MKKITCCVALSALLLGSGGSTSWAENAEAEALNDEGKKLFSERRYLEAYKRFKQAAAMEADARFYFNLCFSLNYLERFEEAIAACEEVERLGPDEKLAKKNTAVLDALRKKATQDPGQTDPTKTDPVPTSPNDPPVEPPPGDPTTPPTNSGEKAGPAVVPGFDPFAKDKPAPDYNWSIGGGIGALGNMGLGDGDFKQDVYLGGPSLDLAANFLFWPSLNAGFSTYFGFAELTTDDPTVPDNLGLFDFGLGVYRHFDIAKNMQVTPMAGAHLAFFRPDFDSEELATGVGLRVQASMDYIFGGNKEHVVHLTPSLGFYSAASETFDITPSFYGLDSGGSTFRVSVGYEYRFSKPFGGGLFTLE